MSAESTEIIRTVIVWLLFYGTCIFFTIFLAIIARKNRKAIKNGTKEISVMPVGLYVLCLMFVLYLGIVFFAGVVPLLAEELLDADSYLGANKEKAILEFSLRNTIPILVISVALIDHAVSAVMLMRENRFRHKTKAYPNNSLESKNLYEKEAEDDQASTSK